MNKISFNEVVQAKSIEKVVIDDCMMTLGDFIAVAKYHAKVEFSAGFVARVKACRAMIDRFLAEGRAIYGVTTGFGENVHIAISTEDAITLQKNIVRSHACAVGKPLSEAEVRAAMLMMIVNTGKGHSGIRLETLECIRRFLNADLYPYAPGEGSVGYLAVEAHIALTFMGEGSLFVDGKRVATLPVLQEKGIIPVEYACKEGLSLLNGSGTATGLAMLALHEVTIAMGNADIVGAMAFEALRGGQKQLDARIFNAKAHIEERHSASNFRRMLKDSEIGEKYLNAKVQDAYIIRSMPHINGAGRKLNAEAYESIMNEMHSVSDNPELFETEEGGIALMCGNFDGTYLATHADMLSMACCVVGYAMESCIHRLVDRNLNDGLPAFLAVNPGLNNGFMIPQYTVAALLNEMKVLSTPASIDSISTCANQEDPVSMDYFAAKKAIDVARKLQYITAIEYMITAQAIDLLAPLKASPVVQKVMEHIRATVAFAADDRFFADDMENLKSMVESGELIRIVEEQMGELEF